MLLFWQILQGTCCTQDQINKSFMACKIFIRRVNWKVFAGLFFMSLLFLLKTRHACCNCRLLKKKTVWPLDLLLSHTYASWFKSVVITMHARPVGSPFVYMQTVENIVLSGIIASHPPLSLLSHLFSSSYTRLISFCGVLSHPFNCSLEMAAR